MVNDFGDLAWQRFGNDEEAEIFVHTNDGLTQVTSWLPDGNRAAIQPSPTSSPVMRCGPLYMFPSVPFPRLAWRRGI